MNFEKGKMYKLIEGDECLIITHANANVRAAQPLVMCDAARMLAYLDRYFFERENGRDMRDASDMAQRTAEIGLTLNHSSLFPTPTKQ